VLSPFVACLGFDSCHQRHGTCSGVQQPHPDLAVEQVEHEHSPGPGLANSRRELKMRGGVSPTGWYDLRRWLSHGTALQNAIAASAFAWWPAWLVGTWLNRERAVFQKRRSDSRGSMQGRETCASECRWRCHTAAGWRIILAPAPPITRPELRPDNKSMALSACAAIKYLHRGAVVGGQSIHLRSLR
jgi:hypothetical protein